MYDAGTSSGNATLTGGNGWTPVWTEIATGTYQTNITITTSATAPTYQVPYYRDYLHRMEGALEETRRRDAEYRAEMVRRGEARVAARHEAFRRAEALLLEWLDEQQRADYAEHKVIRVTSNLGNLYEVDCRGSIAGNIYLVEDGWRVRVSCVHIQGYPSPDAWLAQVLALEADEESLMQIANTDRITPVRVAA